MMNNRDDASVSGNTRFDDKTEWIDLTRQVVGDSLVALILFGSVARDDAGESSDTDLLIVVDPSLRLTRELYRMWTAASVDDRLSPHFVHLPESVNEAGSLWYEVALDGIVLYANDSTIGRFLDRIREAVDDGRLISKFAYGHRYWVKEMVESEDA